MNNLILIRGKNQFNTRRLEGLLIVKDIKETILLMGKDLEEMDQGIRTEEITLEVEIILTIKIGIQKDIIDFV